MKTFFSHQYEPLSIVEQLIISIEHSIMNKSNWRQKICQEEVNKVIRMIVPELVAEKIKWYQEKIIRKWMQEVIGSIDPKYDPENIFKYALSELRWLANQDFNRYLDGVWGSSELIDQNRRNRLQGLSKILTEQKPIDWHPNSNNQVRNLIHPSLYPLIRGISRDQEGNVIRELKVDRRWKEDNTSKTYQWLPAEVSVEEDGVVFTSKINNYASPKEIDPVLGEVLFKMLPLFELVLNDLENRKDRIDNVGIEYKEGDKYSAAIEIYKEEGNEYDSDNEDLLDIIHDDYSYQTEPIQPKVPDFVPPVHMKDPILRKNLQVIVKMANIELTPDNPVYLGGSWHVEGMKNENIVATGIYYYDVKNISKTKLAFRRAFDDMDIDYEQDDRDGVKKIFGIIDDILSVNGLPSVEIEEGLAMVFPNTYQHMVEPFELADKSQPGHRKILVFWLIDPSDRVLSTKDVAETPITHDQALEHRLKLMAERSHHQDENYGGEIIREVSLCEH